MDFHRYKIKKSFLIPFGLAVCLLAVLLCLSFLSARSTAETVVLVILLCAALPALFEISYRTVTIGADGLTVRKFLRGREIPWESIHQVGVLTVRRKCYLLLTTRRGFYILSNAYGNFIRLVQDIMDRVPPDRVEAEVRQQLEDPPVYRGDVLSIWIAVIVITALIVMKLLHII
ncbi:MAG TPA: PH domain-containing protein [Syntrophales bacterium]|jgi:hypothetical protein|nr:PH domain-containing protein [Syntrophales bacterium]HPX55676.1 PH domain-containing protein [Syntrophales bacterium]